MARGPARNASRHGRVLAGPQQGRHQRRPCPDGDRHRQRGPRRQAPATGPSGRGRSFEHSSADGDREPGRVLLHVGAAIGVLHGSACNRANVVPHAAAFSAVPVAIVGAVKNDVADPERVYFRAVAVAERVDLDAHAHADAERLDLHADPNDERIHAHADPERVCLGYLGADAHRFGVGLVTDFGVTDFGVAYSVVVDGSAVVASHDLDPTSLNGGSRRGCTMAKRSSHRQERPTRTSPVPDNSKKAPPGGRAADTITRARARPGLAPGPA